jgi:hypothetical protein
VQVVIRQVSVELRPLLVQSLSGNELHSDRAVDDKQVAPVAGGQVAIVQVVQVAADPLPKSISYDGLVRWALEQRLSTPYSQEGMPDQI